MGDRCGIIWFIQVYIARSNLLYPIVAEIGEITRAA